MSPSNRRPSWADAPVVAGAGFFALDVLVDERDAYRALGGSAGNVLAILAYFGWDTLPVGKLGQDTAADLIRAEFDALGAETMFLRCCAEVRTPVVYQQISDGRPSYSFKCPRCGQRSGIAHAESDFFASEVAEISAKPNVFFFDRATTTNSLLAQRFRSHGALVLFEPSQVCDDEVFNKCVASSDIVKYASDRIESLPFRGDFVEIQTLGPDGLQYRLGDSAGWTRMPAVPTSIVEDTSGSGDWCSAGALHWLLDHGIRREELGHQVVQDALKFGQVLASMNCLHRGARALARNLSHDRVLGLANSAVSSRAKQVADVGSASLSSYAFEVDRRRGTDELTGQERFATLCCDQVSS